MTFPSRATLRLASNNGRSLVVHVMTIVEVVESDRCLSEDLVVLGMLLLQQLHGTEGIHKDAGTACHCVLQAVQQLNAGRAIHVPVALCFRCVRINVVCV